MMDQDMAYPEHYGGEDGNADPSADPNAVYTDGYGGYDAYGGAEGEEGVMDLDDMPVTQEDAWAVIRWAMFNVACLAPGISLKPDYF